MENYKILMKKSIKEIMNMKFQEYKKWKENVKLTNEIKDKISYDELSEYIKCVSFDCEQCGKIMFKYEVKREALNDKVCEYCFEGGDLRYEY